LKDHLPEKDGIIAGLLVAEMIAVMGKHLVDLRKDLFKTYGPMVGDQKNIPLTPDNERRFRDLVRTPPESLDGRPVVSLEMIDGLKLDFDGDDWFLLRISGTEPLIRCYAEAENRKSLDRLMARGLELIQ
jgi:phosphoglucomutase